MKLFQTLLIPFNLVLFGCMVNRLIVMAIDYKYTYWPGIVFPLLFLTVSGWHLVDSFAKNRFSTGAMKVIFSFALVGVTYPYIGAAYFHWYISSMDALWASYLLLLTIIYRMMSNARARTT